MPALNILAKDPHLRLKKKKLGPTIDLKLGRRELAMMRPWRPREKRMRKRISAPYTEGKEDGCTSEEEARLLHL